MVAALKDVVQDAMSRVKLEIDDKVLDIGCNDGTMLSFYPSFVNPYGYEPAWNLWQEAKKKSRGCIYPTYFPRQMLQGRHMDTYKVITSIAQFYNVEDVNAYVAAIAKCLRKDGIWIVQMQDLHEMLKCNGFDNICHEHVAYWETEAVSRLLDRHGLYVCDEQLNRVNGGSTRYIIKHGARPRIGPTVLPADMDAFGAKFKFLKCDMVALLRQLKAEGKTVLGVAASTKANTMLQYYGIGPDLLPAIADRNKEKVGLVTVGTHIPIISEKELYERKPDFLLALAWHFFEPFRVRYSSLEEAGAKWIVPLPTLQIVGGDTCQPSTVAHLGKSSAKSSYATP
jgi:hypothetical protein